LSTLVEKVHICHDNIHYALIGGRANAREYSRTKERTVRGRSRLPDTCANIDQSADQKSIPSSKNFSARYDNKVCVSERYRHYSGLKVIRSISFDDI
jgi:hypothetical protein